MSGAKKETESKVEVTKRESRHLRGTIAETLASEADHFEETDAQLLKFHGSYQQDDRDARKELRSKGGHKAYRFMVRLAIPGGRVSRDQYLALERLAETHGNSTLRITTRQGFQFHGVLKTRLKETVAAVNRSLLTTLSACGDVERNVMACPAPLADEAHGIARTLANEIARELRPGTRAYHEIWLDGEKALSTEEEEPFYGDTYLPRKFKTGIALEGDNCVDIRSYDCGLVMVLDGSRVRGFHLLIGGGMGMTHRQGDTFAALAQNLGFIEAAHAVDAVRTTAAIFRDHGNRADRRHARLKYLLAEWGLERFREEFRRRASFPLADPLPLERPAVDDHLGTYPQGDGKWFHGVFVENGRILDAPGLQLKTALRRIVEEHGAGIVLTPHQNLLLTDLPETSLSAVERTLRDHGVRSLADLTPARRHSMACPALPTCGLALGDAERVMPDVVTRFEREFASLGLAGTPITMRMTGCPNGCARPYTADIAFVGRGPGIYQIYVGGGLSGDRVVDLFAADVPVEKLVETLHPLLESWAKERRGEAEGLGDYYQRLLGRTEGRRSISGLETPTADLVREALARNGSRHGSD